MTELTTLLSSLPTLFWTAFIEYRLLNRVFEKRVSMFLIIGIVVGIDIISGWANLYFHVVGTVPGNQFYYGIISFLTYLLLFRGSKIKLLFFTVVLLCSSSVMIYIALPFCYSYGANDIEKVMEVINGASIFALILYSIFLEYVGRRFENLRHDLPKDFMIYLMTAMVFVHMAIFAVQEVALMWEEGNLSFLMSLGCSLFAVVGVALIIAAVFAVDRQATVLLRQQQYALQAESFKSREVEWKRISRFKHDFNNHLICLQGLLEQGNVGEAETYIWKLSNTVEQLENKVQTGNTYADALLGTKYNEAIAKEIKVSVDMVMPAELPIEPADLCCILSNIVDNAIEECVKLPREERWISMSAFVRQQQLVLEVKNSLSGQVKIEKGKITSSKKGEYHGYGLENVRMAVEKYNGVIDINAEEWFTFSVLLPINHL